MKIFGCLERKQMIEFSIESNANKITFHAGDIYRDISLQGVSTAESITALFSQKMEEIARAKIESHQHFYTVLVQVWKADEVVGHSMLTLIVSGHTKSSKSLAEALRGAEDWTEQKGA